MTLTGNMLIGQSLVAGDDREIRAINPFSNETLEPAYPGATKTQVDEAAALANAAFASYRETTPEQRAVFLETIASEIMDLGDILIERGQQETGLPQGRLVGERGRTVNQLRLFATVVREGAWHGARIDHAKPERTPMPRADIRLRHIPLGPVAVFGASNFPLAFSVAGGDTASALAAGAPVIVKGHSAHPGTSELVARAIASAIKKCELHEGVFSLIFGFDYAVGQQLAAHPYIKAVGFTGSRSGGVALMQTAAARPEPIPVYAEMSSVNPVFLLPEALKQRGSVIAREFVASLVGSAGQLCTNPGLVIGLESPELDAFVDTAKTELAASQSTTMLTPGIHEAYVKGVEALTQLSSVKVEAQGQIAEGCNQCQAVLLSTTAAAFIEAPHQLGAEVFGACSMVVRCTDTEEMLALTSVLEGQLTATLQMEAADDNQLIRSLISSLELKAGRVLANGFPTGVEVGHAMVHGGPFPPLPTVAVPRWEAAPSSVIYVRSRIKTFLTTIYPWRYRTKTPGMCPSV